MSQLDKKIARQRAKLAYLPKWLHDQSSTLDDLANSLRDRFSQLGGMSDLDEAITLYRSALECRPEGHPLRSKSFSNLGIALWTRFEQLGGMSDLDEAITLHHNALELRPEGHSHRSISLNNLAIALCTRFEQLGGLSDLNEAIMLNRKALDLCPERPRSFINLAIALCNRFSQLGEISDLDEAIALHRNALELCPEGHPLRSISFSNLAAAFCTRFSQLGEMSDLSEGISLHRNALELRPEGHPLRPISFNNLAAALCTRFSQLGMMSDLDEAIALHRNALELRPEGHLDRSMSFSNLAAALYTRFSQLGGMSDLDEAIILHRNALELRPKGHPDRSISLNNLAMALHTRFSQLEGMSDLDEAIMLHRNALELRPEGHPLRCLSLNNLANVLLTQFKQLGGLSDVDEAITLHRKALELRPEGHPDRSMSLESLAFALHIRFKELGGMSDLDEAILLHRNALELRPEGHPDRPISFNNLANALKTRFEELGGISDFDEALTLYRNGLELRPEGHPDRFTSVQGVALCLLQHPQPSKQHREEAFNLYSTLSDVSQSVVTADLDAARAWVNSAEELAHPTTLSAYRTSLRLLATHLAALPCLPQHLSILKENMSSLAMDAFSASVRHGTLADAAELLEQGRGVFWSQLTRLRSPVDEVIASGPKGKLLGERFLSVSRTLRNILDSRHVVQNNQISGPKSPNDQAWHLTNVLREVVSDIRKLPAFTRFLLSPLFSDLQRAASGGPVVIVNASKYGCDALIVFHDRDPIHIPLPITKARVKEWSVNLGNIVTKGKEQDVQRELAILLRELWEHVVSPVVQVLQEFCPRHSRIWWCPTAEFSHLPLHAAGEYRPNKQNFSDLYISSYTPTLTALIRSRRTPDSTTGKPRFLAVGIADTLGQATLEHVYAELASIRDSVDTHATFTCIEGDEAQVGKVCEELQQNEFVHFACHGIPQPEQPFESGFALGDGLLKIQDIMQYDLEHSRLATLSACHATVGYKGSPDEAIHLAAAMQFVGFRSVVGTMWAVDDAEAEKVMTAFYRHMLVESGHLDHTRSAFALHKALRTAKPSLYQRILFVHIGA